MGDIPPEIGAFDPKDEVPEDQFGQQDSKEDLKQENIERPVPKEENTHKKKREEVYKMLKDKYGIHAKHPKIIQKNADTREDKYEEFSAKEKESNANNEYIFTKLEKINAILESFEAFKRVNSDRFVQVSEQIGELRSNVLTNEREIKEIEQKSIMATDLVKQVQPEKLMTNLQREVARIDELKLRLDGFETYRNLLLDEIKDIKSKLGVFRGTEEILKLQENVRRDIMDIEKVKTVVEGHADKVEQIFIEMKGELLSFNNLSLIIKDLTNSFNGIKKTTEELQVKAETFANKEDFSKLKEAVSSQVIEFGNYLSSVKDHIGDLNKVETISSNLLK